MCAVGALEISRYFFIFAFVFFFSSSTHSLLVCVELISRTCYTHSHACTDATCGGSRNVYCLSADTMQRTDEHIGGTAKVPTVRWMLHDAKDQTHVTDSKDKINNLV